MSSALLVKTSRWSLRGFLGSDPRSVFYFKEASLGGRCLLLQALPAVVAEGRKKKKWNRQPSGDDTRLLSCRVLVFAACGDAAVNNLQHIYQHMRHTKARTHFSHSGLMSPCSQLFIPPMRFLSSGVCVCVCVLVYFHCGLASSLVFPPLKKNSLHALFSYSTRIVSFNLYCDNFICFLFVCCFYSYLISFI